MPWRESSFMSERLEFVKACLDRSERIVVICNRFGISEKTGQKWLKRFRDQGTSGLGDRSHARLTQSHRMSEEVAERIVALRKKYPLYGAEKLRGRFSCGFSESMGCRAFCELITGSRLLSLMPWAGSGRSPCGGSGLASSRSTSLSVNPRRTELTSAFTKLSRLRRHDLPRTPFLHSSDDSICTERSTTRYART